jgi:3-deoxy-manno-octulosonate cytidylyltransferase (CMP-KDO synthetase)
VVKAVLGQTGDALYFSRLPIPFARDGAVSAEDQAPRLRHLRIYAYSAVWLLQMARLPPSPLEEYEKLEPVARSGKRRAYQSCRCSKMSSTIAIDTPHDLQQAEAHLRRMAS